MKFLLVTGLDGCGKTTQVQELLRDPAISRRWVYVWGRWEPRVTALLMSAWRRRAAGLKGGERPSDDAGHEQFLERKQRLFRSGWKRGLWTTAVLLEYLPQLWFRLLPALLRGKGVLCDRAHPDLWVDLAVNFGGDPQLLRALAAHPLSRCFPRIERFVHLRVSANTGYRRKMDGTPLAYLEARAALYARLAEQLPSRVVDAEQTMPEVQRALREALADALGVSAEPGERDPLC